MTPLSDAFNELLLEAGADEFLLEDESGEILLEEQPSTGAGGFGGTFRPAELQGIVELIPNRLWISDGQMLRAKITEFGINAVVNLSPLFDPIIPGVKYVQRVITVSLPLPSVLDGLVRMITTAVRANRRILLHGRSMWSPVVLVAALVLRTWNDITGKAALAYVANLPEVGPISLPFRRYLLGLERPAYVEALV